MQRAARGFMKVIFPPVCSFCNEKLTEPQPVEGVCRSCQAKIPFRSAGNNRVKCLEERKGYDSGMSGRWNMDVLVACNYDNMMRKALVSMKFYEAAYMKHTLGSILSFVLGRQPETFDGILPIPLHESRMKERGYNQAELIGEKISEITGIPLVTNCLVRRKNTKRQSEMDHYSERLQNVSHAFFCISPEKLINKNILILDDILTSGETLISAACAVREALHDYQAENPGVKGNIRLTGLVLASGRNEIYSSKK